MTKRTVSIYAEETHSYADEIEMDVPDDIAADPAKLLDFVNERANQWWLDLATDGRHKTFGFEAKEVTLVAEQAPAGEAPPAPSSSDQEHSQPE